MKYVAQFLVGCLLILPAAARSGGGHGGGGAHGGGGFHGAVGGGHAAVSGGYHGTVSGGYRGGYGGYHGNVGFRSGVYGYNRYRYGAGLSYWPGAYSYPYYGYGYGYDYYPGYDYGYSYPSYDYDYSPPVVIYPQEPPAQYYQQPPAPVHSEIHEYPDNSTTSVVRPAGEQPIYLIALKGQENIQAAITYWVEGSTLQYLNLQHQQKHVPLDSVDRALSFQLNHDRNMDLRLPPAP
jgi:hypothetical protein